MFWRLSDYGCSTGRIAKWFFYLSGGLGPLHWTFAMLSDDHSIVTNLRRVDDHLPFGGLHTLDRSLYFSIVTMTILGFGDIHAAAS